MPTGLPGIPILNLLAADAVARPRNRLKALGADLALAAQAGAIFARVDTVERQSDVLNAAESGLNTPYRKVPLFALLDLVECIRQIFDDDLVPRLAGPLYIRQ